MCILIDILSRAMQREKKAWTISNFELLLVIFRVAGEASMAVKGLISTEAVH